MTQTAPPPPPAPASGPPVSASAAPAPDAGRTTGTLIVLIVITLAFGAFIAILPFLPGPTPLNEKTGARGDKVVLYQIRPLDWGRSGNTTFVGALVDCLPCFDRRMGYSAVLADSGMAFRTRWFVADDGGKPSAQSPVVDSPEVVARAARAAGLELVAIKPAADHAKDMDALVKPTVGNLDRGHPVLTLDAGGNTAIVYAYIETGNILLLRTYDGGRAPTRLNATDLKSAVTLVKDGAAPLPPEKALRIGLEAGAKDAGRAPEAGVADGMAGKFYYGGAAYDQWIAALEKADRLPDKQKGELSFVSWWTMYSLQDARESAADALREALGRMPETAREPLKKAANTYAQISRRAADALANKKLFANLQDHPDQWTAEQRKEEIALLKSFKELDDKALAEAKEGLEAK